MKRLLLLISLIGIFFPSFSQIFSQNFTSSTVLTSYTSPSGAPGNNQFTTIGASNSNSEVLITNNALRIRRVTSGTAGTAQFTRNSLASVSPTFLAIKFTLSVSGSAAAATTAATFYVGNALPTANSTDPSSSNAHSRFGINLTTNSTEFALRNINGSGVNSATFSGAQQLFLAVNNSGGALNYKGPDNIDHSLPDDTWDLWVGNTRVFTAITAWGSSVDLNGFRLMFTGTSSNVGAGNIDITNIEVHTLTTLPVSLLPLNAKASGKNIDLSWKTTSETNNSHFDILRSGDGQEFIKIGTVKGAGTTRAEQSYIFTDANPLPGTNYYKLNQVDLNGAETLSNPVSAKSNMTANNFKIVGNADHSAIELTIFAATAGSGAFAVYDLSGRKVLTKSLSLSKGYNTFSLPISSSKGVHVASLTTGTETVTNKFIQ